MRRRSYNRDVMKIIPSACLFIMLCTSITSVANRQAQTAKDPRLSTEERGKIVKMLLDSQKDYLESIENLTDAQWSYKPSPFRWSVGEVAEHIVLTENALFNMVERALAQKANPEWENKTAGKVELLERLVPSRVRRVQAPIEVRPSGKMARDEVIRRFKQVRTKALEFAQKTDLPIKAHTVDHPFPVFNTLSAYDWLVYIPLHNVRHNQQIAEVKASAGYPK
jgi:hypothetical protein